MPEESKTLFLIAGEPSGDSRGAELVQALKKENPHLRFEGLGGPKMQAAGVKLFFDLTTISALGFGDVLRQYFQIRQIFYNALRRVHDLKPACIVLIDYPGFNLRFAKKIKRKFPVFYYVSPQIWAWGKRRIHTIRRVVNHMIVLFKFEESLYREAGIPVTWVGHPLVETVKPSKSRANLLQEFKVPNHSKVIALLAGSREAEIRRILPVMLESAKRISHELPETAFLLSESTNVAKELYEEIVSKYLGSMRLIRVRGRMHDLLSVSQFAMVTSGTATLETALFSVPLVILYKAAWSTYLIGKQLVKVSFLGIPNIIAGRKIASEFIQQDAEPEKIAREVLRILFDQKAYEKMVNDLNEVKEKLGPAGASERAAKVILAQSKD